MSNLLDKASVILTPTAYDNGKALCVKPSDGSGDFDFSRNSAATRVNAQGLVENVQILSSNLVQNGDFSEEGVQEVSNGSFSQEGVQLITNGDFATDSDWSKQTSNWTIANGYAVCDGLQTSNSSLFQDFAVVNGVSYKIDFTITDSVNNLNLILGATIIGQYGSGTHSVYVTKDNGGPRIFFQATSSNNFAGSIDNVSVREVGQDWDTFGTIDANNTVSFANNELTLRNDGSGSGVKQDALTSGKTYKVVVNVTDIVGNGFKVDMGNLQNITTTGTKTFYLKATTASLLLYRNSTSPQAVNGATITNISVKEVGMDWTLGTGWEIGEDKVLGDGTMGANVLGQNVGFTQGNSYKFSFTIEDYVSGSIYIREPFNGYLDAVNSNGNYSFYYVAGASNQLDFRGNSFVGSITNISVIEITDDTNLPRINYEGFSYQDALGSEEIVNGDFATDSNWIKQGGWSISGGKANCDGTSNNAILQGFSIPTGTLRIKFDVTEVSQGYVRLFIDKPSFTFLISAYAVGSYEYDVVTTANSGAIWFYATNNFIGSIDNVSVKEYLGQEVVPNSGCGSWLWEPQSTNLITQSEDLSNMQIAFGGAISLDSNFTNPSGQNGSYFIYDTDGGSEARFRVSNAGFTLGDKLSYSVFLKSNSSALITIGGNYGGESCVFNVGTKTLISQGAAVNSYKIINFTNGWTRYIVNTTFTDTIGTGNAYPFFTTNATLSEKIYLWGHQLEQQSYATSYIPTSGSQVTRNQDLCTNGGSLATINSTEGVLYAEIASLSNIVPSNYISLSDGTYSNRISILYTSGTNIIRAFLRVGGAVQADMTFTVSDITEFHKVAFKFKENDFALWIDGLEVATDTSGSTLPNGTLTKLAFSEISTTGGLFRGKTKALAVWKEALSDQELTELTTI